MAVDPKKIKALVGTRPRSMGALEEVGGLKSFSSTPGYDKKYPPVARAPVPFKPPPGEWFTVRTARGDIVAQAQSVEAAQQKADASRVPKNDPLTVVGEYTADGKKTPYHTGRRVASRANGHWTR